MSWIGVDFDRTLAVYNGWTGHAELGAPIQPMVDRVKQWLKEGKEVRIFTARISNLRPEDLEECLEALRSWCRLYIGQELPITNVKDMHCVAIYDDIAIQVIPNTGQLVETIWDLPR
jgi:hypothetical protein